MFRAFIICSRMARYTTSEYLALPSCGSNRNASKQEQLCHQTWARTSCCMAILCLCSLSILTVSSIAACSPATASRTPAMVAHSDRQISGAWHTRNPTAMGTFARCAKCNALLCHLHPYMQPAYPALLAHCPLQRGGTRQIS